ncbi:polysaccharide deacetylase family protein [Sporosarcina globispora]|uniref:polysaccharide deacetylase family protein n=1 Tax=Sporosarcina globispora TaxID=1459 RepID=UPI0009E6AF08|nr:polysaccharide deacetylase family protein [Sporosarcina globispora]
MIRITLHITLLNPNGKYITLTFDDGTGTQVTPLILDIFKEHNAKVKSYWLIKSFFSI